MGLLRRTKREVIRILKEWSKNNEGYMTSRDIYEELYQYHDASATSISRFLLLYSRDDKRLTYRRRPTGTIEWRFEDDGED